MWNGRVKKVGDKCGRDVIMMDQFIGISAIPTAKRETDVTSFVQTSLATHQFAT